MIQSATLMVQQEVAQRCIAKADSADFSSFSVFLQFYANVRYGFLVPPNCFYPAPKVDSAVIHLDLQRKFAVLDEKEFFKIVRTAFMQKRKMLRSSLRELYDVKKIEKVLEQIGMSPTARPSELAVEQWVDLIEKLS